MADLNELISRVDRELDDDRKFFEAHPNREFRVRKCFPKEKEAFDRIAGIRAPAGLVVWVAVHQIRPGVRARATFFATSRFAGGQTEESARGYFQAFANEVPNV